MADRTTLVKLYLKHYGIKCSQDDIENLSDRQLLIKLEHKLHQKREKWAAIQIQAIARRFLMRIKYLKILDTRHNSAIRIQRCYRNWRTWTIIPRIWRKHKTNAAFLVQKYLRGYLVFSKYIDGIRMKKFELNYKHFSEVREQQKNESQALIRSVFEIWHEKKLLANQPKKPKPIRIKTRPITNIKSHFNVERQHLSHNNKGFMKLPVNKN